MKRLLPAPVHNYLEEFSDKTFVIKLSGELFSQKPGTDSAAMEKVFDDIKKLREAGIRVVLTYGGRPEMDDLIRPLGGTQLHKDTGLRITPKRAMHLIEDESFQIGSARIPPHLKDGRFLVEFLRPRVLQAERVIEHGETGRVIQVNREEIEETLERGKIPILGFTGMEGENEVYINPDASAASIAVALEARKLILLTRTDGIQVPIGGNGDRTLSFADAYRLFRLLRKQRPNGSPVIEKGMLPKVEAAIEAVYGGVEQVHIVHFRKLLQEILTRTGVGTLIERHQTHRVEQASEKDLEAIRALHRECSGPSARTPRGVPFLKPLSSTKREALLPGTLILRHRGLSIGTIYSEPVEGKSEAAYIGGFAVAEDHQGEQQGQLLMEEMLRRLREQGIKTAVSITANPHVKKLYQRLGGTEGPQESWQASLLSSARRRYGEEQELAQIWVFDLSKDSGAF